MELQKEQVSSCLTVEDGGRGAGRTEAEREKVGNRRGKVEKDGSGPGVGEGVMAGVAIISLSQTQFPKMGLLGLAQ